MQTLSAKCCCTSLSNSAARSTLDRTFSFAFPSCPSLLTRSHGKSRYFIALNLSIYLSLNRYTLTPSLVLSFRFASEVGFSIANSPRISNQETAARSGPSSFSPHRQIGPSVSVTTIFFWRPFPPSPPSWDGSLRETAEIIQR